MIQSELHAKIYLLTTPKSLFFIFIKVLVCFHIESLLRNTIQRSYCQWQTLIYESIAKSFKSRNSLLQEHLKLLKPLQTLWVVEMLFEAEIIVSHFRQVYLLLTKWQTHNIYKDTHLCFDSKSTTHHFILFDPLYIAKKYSEVTSKSLLTFQFPVNC